MTAFDFEAKDLNGNNLPLKEFKGKALLIVNVASQCGFTPQYEGLEALYQKFKDQGLVILGFPCNQFGAQEPGNEEEIRTFCDTRFRVTFPMFAKIDVNGEDTHPLYQFLKQEGPGLLGSEAIKWNFTKFLVTPEGKVAKRFAPQTKPEALEGDVAEVLPK